MPEMQKTDKQGSIKFVYCENCGMKNKMDFRKVTQLGVGICMGCKNYIEVYGWKGEFHASIR